MGVNKMKCLLLSSLFLCACNGFIDVESTQTFTETSFTNSTTETTSFLEEEKLSYKNCKKTTVFFPETGNLLVSCIPIESEYDYINNFEYYIFSSDSLDFSCAQADHQAIWFVSNNENELLSNKEDILYSKLVKAKEIEWINNKVDAFIGSAGIVKVSFDEDFFVEKGHLFCFGHVVNTTCPIVCQTDSDLSLHQIATDINYPYNFIPIQEIGFNYALISLAKVKNYF